MNLAFRRCVFTAFAAAAASLCVTPAVAQPWPTKQQIKIVAPQLPGGATDGLSRLLAQKLTERLGQTVIVDNRPGANGGIGTAEVARAAPDGYTFVMANDGTHSINPALYKTLGYDAIKDFTGVAIAGRVPFVLITSVKSPFNTIDDMIAASKKKEVTYGSAGVGSVNHLIGSMVQSQSGANLLHVAYKGASQALPDVITGQVDVFWGSIASVAPYIKDGRVKALAVTTAKRAPSLPNVPAQAESPLLKGFDVAPWFGLMAPAGTSPEVIARVNKEVRASLEEPDTINRLALLGAVPDNVSPEGFNKIVRDDLVRWTKVVKESGATNE